jgi:L-threonylcarbamoyladenylate synthase
MLILPPSEDSIRAASQALLAGELVGMPTETVYGLAAVATNPAAIERVFRVKGRPSDNPLIVHLADVERVPQVATGISREAEQLAAAFWPGPITLVLLKNSVIPDSVTAGRPTVAVRVPSHPVALALLRATDRPLAAPSANLFTSLSPTRAEHIDPEIGDQLAMILDGGPCEIGLESTVVDCTGSPVILRPGRIRQEEIEAVLGHHVPFAEAKGKAPGQYPRHYAPRTPLMLVTKLRPQDAGLTFGPANEGQIQMPADPDRFAARLYAALHELDQLGASRVYVEKPPLDPQWNAVWDRLRKASTHPS